MTFISSHMFLSECTHLCELVSGIGNKYREDLDMNYDNSYVTLFSPLISFINSGCDICLSASI